MSSQNDPLFCQNDLREVLQNEETKLLASIDRFNESELLSTDPEGLANDFASKYSIHVPMLKGDETETSQGAIKIDVSGDPSRIIFDRGGPVLIDGTRFTFHVPFTGDNNLFRCRPSTYSLNPPYGRIVGNELQLSYEQIEANPEELKSRFARDLAEVQTHLDRITSDVNPFNGKLKATALAKINQRREKLSKAQSAVEGLGFPVRRKE